jgi:ABC-type multidrug transport system ATPase subunit
VKISLEHISKRFQRHWIFKDINYSFSSPAAYALLGPNGSGKSTLLRIIAGMQSPSLGKLHYHDDSDAAVAVSDIYQHVSFCAPGQELVEELTLREFLDFHFSFKRPLKGLAINDIVELTGLQSSEHIPIGDYSSGMKQRVKLAQAIFSDARILLLDEPCTNLDQKGVEQYHRWVEQYKNDRLVIVASNDEREYFFCNERLVVEAYK